MKTLESVDVTFARRFPGEIEDYEYAGAIFGKESEKGYWERISALHGLRKPAFVSHCFCGIRITNQPVIFHKETKEVHVVGTTCIIKVMHGLWKKCQNCDEKYTGTSYYCKVCLPGKRCALKNEKQAVTNQGTTAITFGKHKRE